MLATRGSPNRQTGAALLAFALLLVVSFSAVLLAMVSKQRSIGERASANAAAFQRASDALLGYALAYPEITGNPDTLPGRLPCPDFDGDGDADSPCNGASQSSIGWLPWRTLGIPPLRDHSGTCLWYVVSGQFKQGASLSPSSESDGMIIVEDAGGNPLIGSVDNSRAIALLMAPGRTLGSQNRNAQVANLTECGATGNAPINNPANYFDTLGNYNNAFGTKSGVSAGDPGSDPLPADVASIFVSAQVASSDTSTDFNDQLGWIQPSDYVEVYRRMDRWVANRVRRCVLAYGAANGGRYPWAAMLDDTAPVDFFDDNGQRFGRVPAVLSDTVAANPGMSANWPVDPLDSSTTCFNWSWWPQWRNQVFYSVHDSNAPVTAGGTGNLTANTNTAEFVVLIGGRSQPGQERVTNAELGTSGSYLEGANTPVLTEAGGDESFVSDDVLPFNDVLCDQSQCYD